MTVIIAHRGARASAPENTIEAFQLAIDQGAHGIELDVRRTSDDVLVVHHDAHLPDGRVLVETLSDDLPKSVPLFVEALETCTGIWLNVEIKNFPGDPDYDEDNTIAVAVAGLVSAFRTPDDVLVSSFNTGSLRRFQAVDSTIPVATIAFDVLDPQQLIERAVAESHAAVNPYLTIADRRFVERAHDAGLAVNVWTVNDVETIIRMAGYGVDGIITDDPALALRALRN